MGGWETGPGDSRQWIPSGDSGSARRAWGGAGIRSRELLAGRGDCLSKSDDANCIVWISGAYIVEG